MDQVPIGAAARRLGLRTSALRYYEQRGLVRPARRVRGQRVYGRPELRRLAFVQIAQRLGIPLDTAAAVLDGPSQRWHATVTEQIAALDALISRAHDARAFLGHALACPAEHPARDCPHLTGVLDRLLDGTPLDQIADEHLPAGDASSSRPAR